MRIACFWAPAQSGGGGPVLSAPLLRSLAKLQIPVWFDVYPSGSKADYHGDASARLSRC
jgi:hypothetical protein